MENVSKAGRFFMKLAIPLLILSVVGFFLIMDEVLPFNAIFLSLLITPFIVTGASYFIGFFVEAITDKESRFTVPLVCLAITIITVIIGLISFINDHNFILRGLGAQLLWFFISLPSLVAAIVLFIIAVVKNNKELKELKNQE
ncbi:hypothetical protein SAMN02910369_01508 [Lachnospiraceae bacterium NE2001]|nr:hypothetical protein SAMN02910369_01508 [Lachnospiraceae bacterium NE2001]